LKGEKKMKKIIVCFLIFVMGLNLSGCFGNASITDGLTNDSNTFHYALTHESGEYRLHEISKWSDSSSDALGITTKCCNNRIWTSYNSSILYKEKPVYLSEDVIICK